MTRQAVVQLCRSASAALVVLALTRGALSQEGLSQEGRSEPENLEPLTDSLTLEEDALDSDFSQAKGSSSGLADAEYDDEDAPPPTLFDEIMDSLTGGEFGLNLRLRAEIVNADGRDTGQAYTSRLRLGYTTKPFHGLSFGVDFEDVRTADDDLYNAAGTNGQPRKGIVADIEDTELNQFFAKYESEWFTAIAGRQRLILDDSRFVGNVGWRQNEQTFDAYTVTTDWLPDTNLLYSYVDDVNRIFGPTASRDFRSDAHLINASYSGLPIGKLVGFAYLLDFPNSPANSSDTVGTRLTGSQELDESLLLDYAASVAYQVDARPNPTDYAAFYYAVDAALAYEGVGKAGAGYEVLASDDGRFAFRTPLATLHKFNGWADVFLTTPAGGLEDLYFYVGAKPFLGIQMKAVFHLFFSEHLSSDLGTELDVVVSKAFNDHLTLLGKASFFEGQAGLADVQRIWVQLEFAF